MLQLFSYFRSSAAYRVRIALNLKAVGYVQEGVNLVADQQRSDSYMAINPQGLVPALRLENGTVLSQSTAILEWLEEAYPELPLYPKDPIERAKARALTNSVACDIHPLNNLRVLKYLAGEMGITDEQKTSWYHHWIAQGFTSLENQLTATPYSMGDRITMVDVYLIPQIYNALRFKQDMTPFPKIMQVYAACNVLDAFKTAAPEVQPDAK